MPDILWLVYYFFTTGLFAVGGGLATLPFLYEIGQKTGWYGAEDVANMVAIAQSTPGPTGINMATYVGFQQFGIAGAILGPLSIVLPSLIIIIIISQVLGRFRESQLVQNIFYGLRPASTGLILAAAFSVIQISLLNLGTDSSGSFTNILGYFSFPSIALAIVVFGIYRWKKPHPIFLIIFAGAVGAIFEI